MNKPDLVYTTYIKTTPEKLWAALTNPEFTRQYWGNNVNRSDWRPGSRWNHVDGADSSDIMVTGEVLESIPPKRLVLTWASPADLADVSRVTFEIEPVADLVRLNVVHGYFTPGSVMAGRVVQGWPLVLASLKSLLETGAAIDILAVKGKCAKTPVA
jgi:uncharacterized protein YndB with AHSA1/START domain